MKGMNHLLSMSFSILWRLSILILPWQTRWIFDPGSIDGFAWEQGTVCLYAGQVLLLAAVVVGAVTFREKWKSLLTGTGHRAQGYASIAIFLFLLSSLFTANWTATLMWFGQTLLLVAFVRTLMAAKVGSASVARWVVISVLPHAGLGIWQYMDQYVHGSSVFGMATQDPTVSGVSVVEHGLYRVLRSYGGFPHPNIFGGWLAIALVLLPDLVRRAQTKLEKVAYVFAGAFFVSALVFAFGQGAWIAAVAGFALAVVSAWKHARERLDQQGIALLVIAVLGVATSCVASQWDHVIARFDTSNRLERWSVEQRGTAIEEGIEAARARPLAGWGPGAGLIGVSTVRDEELRTLVAPEPPHALPVVVLLEAGVIGLVVVFYLAWSSGIHREDTVIEPQTTDHRPQTVFIPLLFAIALIAMTDHYLWTLWPGQALAAVVIAMIVLRDTASRLDTDANPRYEEGVPSIRSNA
jgi:hypothetical protein